MKRSRPLPAPHRRLTAAGAVLLAGLVPGCAAPTLTVTVPRIERLSLADPAASPRDIDRALAARAEHYAAGRPGAQTWRGRGLSMEPLLPPDSWLVTEAVPYPSLQPGQVVLYRSPTGRLIAHALVKPTRQGWLTVGVNNAGQLDPARVTPTNYLGVVTAAFTLATSPAPPGPP